MVYTYLSQDSIDDAGDDDNDFRSAFPVEYLNSINMPCIPKHELKLKMSRRPGQRKVSAFGPDSSEPLTPGLRPSRLVSEPQWPIVISSSPSWGNPSDSDDSDSERTLDVVAEETPMPPPSVPPVVSGGVYGPSIHPRWVRRSVSAVRDFPPGCGPSSSTSRPPIPPSVPSGASSPIPYHVHRVVNQSLIREQSPGLAAQLDQIPVGPFQGIPAPSPDVQDKVSVNQFCPRCRIEICGHLFLVDLIPFQLGEFDVILGMDWLSQHKANIDSKKLLRQGCEAYLAHVVDTEKRIPELEKISVMNEFPDVFPDELPGLPPDREIEFSIDSIPGAEPVSKAP
ncbi:hypothetical protein AgCh_009889 [Apium graveolens]